MIRNACKLAFVGAMVIAAAAAGFVTGDRLPPVKDMIGVVFPVKAHRGETVEVRWKAKVYRTCRGEAHQEIVDLKGDVHLIVERAAGAQMGESSFTRTFTVPGDIPAGPAKYRSHGLSTSAILSTSTCRSRSRPPKPCSKSWTEPFTF
jgi:hypothetical protein